MRLIDADKLMESLNPKESVWVGLVLSELIANTTTVKAIPIEYIETFKKKVRHIAPAKAVIDWLLENWEKDNEQVSSKN